MDKLLLISKTRYGQHHFEDNDSIDRLNSRYTIIGLILAIGLIMGNVFIGDPINCWTPGSTEINQKENLQFEIFLFLFFSSIH